MVAITGDTHGDFERISHFCHEIGTTKDNIMVILGDSGINYTGGIEDELKKKVIADIPINILCLHGNHENRPENIPTYHLTDFAGGKAYIEDEYPNLFFAKDGEIYDLEGHKALAIGSANSIDKKLSLATNRRWWPDKKVTEETKKQVEAVLERNNWRVNIVLSHTCPYKYIPLDILDKLNSHMDIENHTETERWLDYIGDRLDYDRWYCGHGHINKVSGKMVFLSNIIVMLRRE